VTAQRRLKDAALVEVQRLEDELSRLRKQLQEALDDAAAQKRQKDAALLELERVEDEMNAYKKKYEACVIELELLTEKHTVLTEKHTVLTEKHTVLTELHGGCAGALDAALRNAAQPDDNELQQKYDLLSNLLEKSEEELARLRKALQKAEDGAIALRRQEKAARAEADEAKLLVDEWKIKYQKLSDEHAVCADTIGTLEEELEKLRIKLKAVLDAADDLANAGADDGHLADLAKKFAIRNAVNKWESFQAKIVGELFAGWKEVYNLAREDATRKACATQLLRKYMQQMIGDARARAISTMRSNWMKGSNNFHHDEDKDKIFADALVKARTELPFLWEAEVGAGEWKAHEPSVCAQLEDAIVRSKDQLAVTSQRKSFLMWIHGRTQIDVATGRNHGLRRRKPEIMYKTVAPSEDQTVQAPVIPGTTSPKPKAAAGNRPPRSPQNSGRGGRGR